MVEFVRHAHFALAAKCLVVGLEQRQIPRADETGTAPFVESIDSLLGTTFGENRDIAACGDYDPRFALDDRAEPA